MESYVLRLSDLTAHGRWDPKSLAAARVKQAAIRPDNYYELRDLVQEVRATEDPPTLPSVSFIYIGLENVESVTGDIIGKILKKGGEIKSRAKRFQAGDVLYGRLRPSLAKAYWCPAGNQGGICSGEFVVLRPRTPSTSGRVIRQLLTSPNIVAELNGKVAGAALPRISSEDLLSVLVPDLTHSRYIRISELIAIEDKKRYEAKAMLAAQPELLHRLAWSNDDHAEPKRSRNKS